ncbi:hypothetical protein GGR53DRAFT_468232 [Hypoxylon sp. FL1150]|nr:hypothetical protein GGR53DRAFT_468232 [Hypoxylon sp. FL1150]
MLMLSGAEAKVKQHAERLEKTKSLLMLVIVSHGEEVAEESLSITRSKLRLELRGLLQPCDYNFIPQNLSGTCEWIWTNPVFARWVTIGATGPVESVDRIMCIYGTGGCGKSVLAASIVKRLEHQDKVSSLFSFRAVRGSQRKLVDFLRTYLWHLLRHASDEDLYPIYTPLMKPLSMNEHNLGDAIKLAGELVGSTLYCVIDAVDESLDDWSRSEDGSLNYILELIRTVPNLCLILLGREPALRAAMSIIPSNIEITEDVVMHDIYKFIDVELDRSLNVQTPAIRELVRQSLQE